MDMKQTVLAILGVSCVCISAQAQERIYRCGNEYTNTVSEAQAKGCKLVEGGNVTVVQGTRQNKASTAKPASSSATPATSAGNGARVDASEQKSRDSDARLILESELKKAEARHVELLKEYNNGEPEKQGIESRNHQKYLDRVAEIKANLQRNESDIAGIRRELGRVSPSSASAAAK